MIKRTQLTDERLQAVREAMKAEGLSIRQACIKLSIPYTPFIIKISRAETEELRELWKQKKRAGLPKRLHPYLVPVTGNPPTTPRSPVRDVTIKSGPSEEYTKRKDQEMVDEMLKQLESQGPAQNEDSRKSYFRGFFPNVLYRIHQNFIGRPVSTKLSFFIRVEADVYYVAGYQYGLAEFPGEFRTDANLFDYNTDVEVALSNLQRVLNDKLCRPLDDKLLGKIFYSYSDVTPYNARLIIAKTAISAPDGEYMARVSGDVGRIDTEGKLWQFAIPENLAPSEVPCVVNKGIVTLHV